MKSVVVDSKSIGKYALIAAFSLASFFFLYLFFRLVFNFWLSDFVAILPAAGAVYLMAFGLARSKMNIVHKILAVAVILATIAALVLMLLAMSATLNRVVFMIGK